MRHSESERQEDEESHVASVMNNICTVSEGILRYAQDDEKTTIPTCNNNVIFYFFNIFPISIPPKFIPSELPPKIP